MIKRYADLNNLEVVREIAYRWAVGGESQTRIARQFGYKNPLIISSAIAGYFYNQRRLGLIGSDCHDWDRKSAIAALFGAKPAPVTLEAEPRRAYEHRLATIGSEYEIAYGGEAS